MLFIRPTIAGLRRSLRRRRGLILVPLPRLISDRELCPPNHWPDLNVKRGRCKPTDAARRAFVRLVRLVDLRAVRFALVRVPRRFRLRKVTICALPGPTGPFLGLRPVKSEPFLV